MLPGVAAMFVATLGPGQSAGSSLNAVPFTEVTVKDDFWAPRIRLNREKVLPHNFKFCEQTGRISNFAKAAKLQTGEFEGIYYNDSDVYKVIEGAAYSLAQQRDPALEKTCDDVIAKIVAAQQPDGYLNSYFTLVEPDNRWIDENKHETYCAGHLFEAAVAYFQATGKRALLNAAIKLADHIDSVFGPGKKSDATGHQEIELALVKLWRVTRQERYLKLAQFFLDARGHYEGRTHIPRSGRVTYGEYNQDHKPVRDQTEIVGHAVRAMYLYSGVADIAAIKGDSDYLRMMDRIWDDVVHRKMYVTGGIGPSAKNEGFTVPYDLPNDSAYAETCAAFGMAIWAHRMNLLHADAAYADVVERAIYNGLLAGVALDGEKYFYVNPLASRGFHHRRAWYDCSCCPTNVARFLPTVGGYQYATRGSDIFVNHFIAGEARVSVGDNLVVIHQQTRYPWDGEIRLTVEPKSQKRFALFIRIPGWCQGPQDELYETIDKPRDHAATLKLNGKPLDRPEIVHGYAKIDREWARGDVVELSLPMPVRRIKANAKVAADVGRIALQRGPIVYCLEGADNPQGVRDLAIPRTSELHARHRADLLGGVTTLTGRALVRQLDGPPKPAEFVAIPYYAWDNRSPGPMVVWLPEDVSLAEPQPGITIASRAKATASHCWSADNVEALHDQVEPASSDDESIPRLTWWNHRGTQEWAQYDFAQPVAVREVEVYWFDDSGHGACRVPRSWRLLYRAADQWKPVANPSGYGTQRNRYNRVSFDSVTTDALRLDVTLAPDVSGGILEWRVTGSGRAHPAGQ